MIIWNNGHKISLTNFVATLQTKEVKIVGVIKNKSNILEAFKTGQKPNVSYDSDFDNNESTKTIIKNLSPLY